MAINSYVFSGVILSAVTLHVPSGKKADYKAADVRKNFLFDVLTVSPETLTFTSAGEALSVAVTSDISRTASADAAWITVAPASGSNDGTISVTAEANTTTLPRTATLTVTGGGITQEAAATPSEVVPTGVALNQHNVSPETGETVQLSATVSPANATNSAVTWTSSDTQVATVSGTGLVTAGFFPRSQ